MSLTTYKFKQVDVFTDKPYGGNPLAVVYNADNISTEKMALIAKWTNLSETIFLETPTETGADYKVRIFCPDGELPFAGHPTLGACYLVSKAAGDDVQIKSSFIQQCNIGLIDLNYTAEDEKYYFKLARKVQLDFTELQIERIVGTLGGPEGLKLLSYALFDVGPKWLVIRFESRDQVLKFAPNMTLLLELSKEFGITGCCCFGEFPAGESTSDLPLFETRTFAPHSGINEDPVCGSGAGAVGSHLKSLGLLKQPAYGPIKVSLRQGIMLGRDGKISVELYENGEIRVGGNCVTVIDGVINI